MSSIDEGRKARGELKIPSNLKIPIYFVPSPQYTENPLTESEQKVITSSLSASSLMFGRPSHPSPMVTAITGSFYFPPVDPEVENAKLTKELAKVTKDLEQTRKKLTDPNMLAKAPAAKLDEWRALEMILVEKEASIRESLEKFGAG